MSSRGTRPPSTVHETTYRLTTGPARDAKACSEERPTKSGDSPSYMHRVAFPTTSENKTRETEDKTDHSDGRPLHCESTRLICCVDWSQRQNTEARLLRLLVETPDGPARLFVHTNVAVEPKYS